jgi:hypothetical protein
MPVWITVDGKPVRSRADAEHFVQWMDRTLDRALQENAWNNDAERTDTQALYRQARAKMVTRGEEDK